VAVFVYGIVWNTMIWGVGGQFAARDMEQREGSGSREWGDGEEDDTAKKDSCLASARLRWRAWEEHPRYGRVLYVLREAGVAIRHGLLTPPVLAIAVGIIVGLSGGGDVFFKRGGGLFPLGEVILLLADGAVPLSNLVLAGSLYHGLRETIQRWRRDRSKAKEEAQEETKEEAQEETKEDAQEETKEDALANVAERTEAEGRDGVKAMVELTGVGAGVFEGDVKVVTGEWDRVVDDGERGEGAAGGTPLETHAPSPAEGDDKGHSLLRTMALMCLVRLVLVPAVNFALYVGASWAKIPVLAPGASLDPVIRIVILTEACMPSAQSGLVILQLVGNVRAAQELSTVFLVMYPLALFTMAAWLTLASYIVLVWEPQQA
jgi:predicted permease